MSRNSRCAPATANADCGLRIVRPRRCRGGFSCAGGTDGCPGLSGRSRSRWGHDRTAERTAGATCSDRCQRSSSVRSAAAVRPRARRRRCFRWDRESACSRSRRLTALISTAGCCVTSCGSTGAEVVGAHRPPLGRLQLELGPELVEAVLRKREEDQSEDRPAVLRGREARVRAQRVGCGPESPLELGEVGQRPSRRRHDAGRT